MVRLYIISFGNVYDRTGVRLLLLKDSRLRTESSDLYCKSCDFGSNNVDYTCAVESSVLLHGRMYVTNRYLCFYSNLFGLEKKIRIPFSHIKAITKEFTALVIPNALNVTTCE
jgi:hypothetical protein